MENVKYSTKSLKRFLFKSFVVFVLFLVVFLISLQTKLPEYFDSYVLFENYKFIAHFWLIVYRFIMYFSFPIMISLVEYVKLRKSNIEFKKLLIENFNVLFCTYALIAALYALLGIDKVLGVDIFSNADTFLFVTGFIFTTLVNRDFQT
jgi:hypothetical protein